MVVDVPKKWDHESDVVIIGGGTAGLPAAIVVAEAGLKATVLEARTACGGSLSMVVGSTVFAGTEEQKEAGIKDSPELLYKDMVDICGSDPALAKAFTDNQLEAYWMLRDEGVRYPGVQHMPCFKIDRGLGWLYGVGPKMTKAFEKRARDKGAEILFKHRAQRLYTDAKGRVIGVQVKVGDEMKNFKAKKGVIIATGGFGHNKELIGEYAPEMLAGVPKMPVSHQGDGLKMALALGAATKDIGIAVASSWPISVPEHLNLMGVPRWGGILVNYKGKRFYDESCAVGYYGPMTHEGAKQPGGYYFLVYDSKTAENIKKNEDKGHSDNVDKSTKYIANNFDEVAKLAGIDPKGLKESIDKYHHDIDTVGYDTVFDRKKQWGFLRDLQKLDKPPYYAIKCVSAITSMKGGLKINGNMQVLNSYDEPIPSLYAAGEVTGGLWAKTYLLGVMTSFSMAFGIAAGRNAAKEPNW